jgi:hypothetical protein
LFALCRHCRDFCRTIGNLDKLTRTYVRDQPGSPYVRFRRTLKTGNELLVIATARELPRVPLEDALRIGVLIRA